MPPTRSRVATRADGDREDPEPGPRPHHRPRLARGRPGGTRLRPALTAQRRCRCRGEPPRPAARRLMSPLAAYSEGSLAPSLPERCRPLTLERPAVPGKVLGRVLALTESICRRRPEGPRASPQSGNRPAQGNQRCDFRLAAAHSPSRRQPRPRSDVVAAVTGRVRRGGPCWLLAGTRWGVARAAPVTAARAVNLVRAWPPRAVVGRRRPELPGSQFVIDGGRSRAADAQAV